MKRTIVALTLLVSVSVVLVVSQASAAPEPSAAQIDWQLGIEYKAPMPFKFKAPGEDKESLYWFFLFEITNKSDEDQQFLPRIDLFTDTGDLLRANRGVNVTVFEGIQKLLGEPLLINLPQASGKILQGEDNAKFIVAIFKDFDPKAGQFDLFIGGLSGESTTVKLRTPIVVEEENDLGVKKKVTKTTMLLSKTLHLSYRLNTEAASRMSTSCTLLNKKWIMR
ncbi:MAG: hypothetical protein HN909_07980 [Phycisphaerales bacterium]|jgi:hypothetical protein|nr:hypothetical protein [Phycisphaerales bacterium]MBT7171694.1 hypothetical protein [Phycisphaerales bacterium]